MNEDEDRRTYPAVTRAGGHEIILRLMTAGDREAMLSFARALPEHDLLFLRRDITQEGAVDAWIRDIEAGITTTVLAIAAGQIVGYGAIHRETLPWTRHVAELRVMVAAPMRSHGLGRILTQEAFALALEQGIEKMMGRMTLDQRSAINTFEGLGFRPEALMRNHVKDRDGRLHDLLILSHEVAKFEGVLAALGVAEAIEG